MAQSCQSGSVEPGMGVDRRSGVRDGNHSHRLPFSSEQQHLETTQNELENAKQAADQTKTQARGLAKRAASLSLELEEQTLNGMSFRPNWIRPPRRSHQSNPSSRTSSLV